MAQQVPLKITGTPVVPTQFVATDTVPPANLAPTPLDGWVLTADSSQTAGQKWASTSAASQVADSLFLDKNWR